MNETIDDIIREKRTTAREIRSRTTHQYGLELANMLDAEADRIDAAARSRRELLCMLRDDNIALNIENSELRALVKEMADTLDEYFDDDRISALVDMARAREVCK